MASPQNPRPDPEDLLRRIEAESAHAGRGRLKLFLGYAPRVGKSLRMFDEGRRRKKRGQDVVVGAVQHAGSEELADLIAEFECFSALDVEAILRRAPQVCLIDELARPNPPGSRHAHRWEDVEELRDHGINVIGALNLQHVAESQDEVERITGRRSPNSVPRGFIESADELVIVDVPAEDVASGRLSPSQLSALREAALLLAAQVVEHQLQSYMAAHGILQSWGTQERILVCVTAQSHARAMLESGARAAARFHGVLLAVTVVRPGASRAEMETLRETMNYATRLGAEARILENEEAGKDPIAAIVRFAREQRVTQLFVGHTRQKPWMLWKKPTVARLIDAAEGMDVRIFPASVAARQ